MMTSYFTAFVRRNRLKVGLLILIMGVYFGFVAVAYTLSESIPQIARLPLQRIGVQTIVQKVGKIPAKMAGAIFPHSNAPISAAELRRLEKLAFVQDADSGLYFWYFDRSYFKSVLGIHPHAGIFADILKRNIRQGHYELGGGAVLITADFARKHHIGLHAAIELSGKHYTVSGILKANLNGNIIPADIYMDMATAREITRRSAEMQRIYQLENPGFSNVVLLKTDSTWKGDREQIIKNINSKFLVFGEKTFTREILKQLQLISSSGRAMLMVLGLVIAAAFGVMVVFNLKTRQKEIAVLRMIGWKIADLRRHFIGESLLLLAAALLLGNGFTLLGVEFLGHRTISMELPWDISARPHFLPAENAIERVVTSNIPIHYDGAAVLLISAAFLALFVAVSLIAFARIKKIKPFVYQI